MSSDLREYIDDIRSRTESKGRVWFWEKNAQRPKFVAYVLEYEPFTLLLKMCRYVHRKQMLSPLTRSNRPSGVLRNPLDFQLIRDRGQSNSMQICGLDIANRGLSTNAGEPIVRADRLPSGNRKLIIVHAFYEAEAVAIFDKLDAFTDYDLMLTTPVPTIRDRFLSRFDPNRSLCFLTANAGRDVLPFLLLLGFTDLSGYEHFVKVHTKRSSHLHNGSDWFSSNVEILVGNQQMTDRIFELIDPHRPGIYGVECHPLQDHFRSNRYWLEALLPEPAKACEGSFIPGTMFAGSAEFIRRLAALNLHLHQFEEEKGQLDGCLIHALERYFGYFAGKNGGECATFDSLIASHVQPSPSC